MVRDDPHVVEGRALLLAAEVGHNWCPPVLELDERSSTVRIASAPSDWVRWSSSLAEGDVRPEVANRLGRQLASWHGAADPGRVAELGLADDDAWVAARVDPYCSLVAAEHPDLAPLVHDTARRVIETHTALVHGDFSPRNVLVGDGVWVVGFGLTHLGDPAFDLAFMLSHLAIEAAAGRASSGGMHILADSFMSGYGGRRRALVDEAHVNRLLACLLLVEERTAEVGRSLLEQPEATLAGVWRRLDGLAAVA